MTDPAQPMITIAKTGHKLAPSSFWDTIAPKSFVIFKAQAGDILTIGDKMFILAVFPESSTGAPMSQPDPGALGNCQPTVALAIENSAVQGQSEQVSETYTVTASPYISQVEASYRVRFEDQAELYTSSGAYNKPWVFVLNVRSGMKSASVTVQSMTAPSGCNFNSTSFVNSAFGYPPTATMPTGVQIKTVLPAVVSYKTSVPAGNYTTGAFIDIVVTFTEGVVFSQLPDPSSQASIVAAGWGNVPPLCPFVQLNSNTYAPLSGYALPNDQTKLLFTYQVSNGEATPPGVGLDLAEYTGMQLNGASIKSSTTGLAADLSSMSNAYGAVGTCTNMQEIVYSVVLITLCCQ